VLDPGVRRGDGGGEGGCFDKRRRWWEKVVEEDMDKKNVLVIQQDGEFRDKLKKRLPRAFPHCSFVFESTMRDASETASVANYGLVLLCTRDNDNEDSIREKVDWLFDNCPGANIVLYDPHRRNKRRHETSAVVRRKRWRPTQAIIKAMRRYLPPPGGRGS